MARRTRIELLDDIDGTTASDTITFGLDGVNYDIDLSDEHAQQLRDTIGPWITHARRAGGVALRGTSPTRRSPDQTAAIRAWARANGHHISDRGRIPVEIETAYNSAHSNR